EMGEEPTRPFQEDIGDPPVTCSLTSPDFIAKGAQYAPPLSPRAPGVFQLSIQGESFRVSEGRTRRVLRRPYERPLQPLSQTSNHQQNEGGLPTVGKVGLDPNLESTRRERSALVEQRASFETPRGNHDRVIDGDHRVIGQDANFQLCCRGQVAQAGYPQVPRITPLDLQLKLRYDRAHRVGEVLRDFQSLSRGAAPALLPRPDRGDGEEQKEQGHHPHALARDVLPGESYGPRGKRGEVNVLDDGPSAVGLPLVDHPGGVKGG